MTIRIFVTGVLLALAIASAVGSGSALAAVSTCPSSNHPNEIVQAGGSGQTAQLGKQFAESFQVQLANTNGCPLTGNLAGVNINFDAPGSGASGIFAGSGSREAVIGTNAEGIATAPAFTANYTTGSYTVDAHSDYGSVEFFVSNTAAGLPTTIAATGTTSEEATINGQFAQPLQARVTDVSGNPVQGATVSFSVMAGGTGAGASFLGSPASATTDSNGLATSPPLLANGAPGRYFATASTPGVSAVATFTLDNHDAAMTIAPTVGSGEQATVASRYRQPLQARLLDSSGQPVEGASVTFALSAANNGAGATFLGGATQATALTDANGQARSPALLANTTAGSFTATAMVAGAGAAAEYTLANTAGMPFSITTGTASGESTAIGTAFPIPLAVTVADRYGNPVPDAPVVFAAPQRGATGRFVVQSATRGEPAARKQAVKLKKRRRIELRKARIRSDRNGIAVAPTFTANATTGGYLVVATVHGTSLHASFALVNLTR